VRLIEFRIRRFELPLRQQRQLLGRLTHAAFVLEHEELLAGHDLEQPLDFTQAAARKVAALIAEEGNPALMLRVYISGGGCSGFQYGFSFDEERSEDDLAQSILAAPAPASHALKRGQASGTSRVVGAGS